MKVQIENIILPENLQECNRITSIAVCAKDIKEIQEHIKSVPYYGLLIGFGSTHCWVKQLDEIGNLQDDRLLFICK